MGKFILATGVVVLVLLFAGCRPKYKELQIASPNGQIIAKLRVENGLAFYEISKGKKEVILKSGLGFRFKNIPALQNNFKIAGFEKSKVNETWEQPWGETQFIEDNFNQITIHLQETNNLCRKLDIVFKVFNDGVGFRYHFPSQENLDSLIIASEGTQFRFSANHSAWWIPVHSENSYYESIYRHTPLSAIDTANTPCTIETKNGLFLAIHEANLTNYASMTLRRMDTSGFESELVPWSNGDKVYAKAPFSTPWRTIIIAEKAEDLITSTLMLNLNEPNKLEDISWIKPIKYIGIWWGLHMRNFTWQSGPNHGATTENTINFIDFAADNGFGGVLVEGWNMGWDHSSETWSHTVAYPDFDMEKVCAYAKSKSVQLIGHHETYGAAKDYERQIEEAFAMYQKMGVHNVKTGYVSKYLDGKEWHDGQYGVLHFRKVIELAAQYKITIDNHEPVKPTGLSRTYPNLMTQEGARGQEYNAWSRDGGNPPSHTTILPFTRMLAGPLDYTPGIFNFENKIHPETRVKSTLANQLALFVVLFSPLQMASDLPENYSGNPAFQFIKDVPCNWSETKVLNAKIGEYVTFARKGRNSQDWYLGSITNENQRQLRIDLSFLDEGKNYKAEIYADDVYANWETNPGFVTISTQTVTSLTTLDAVLASGGGLAIRFAPIK